MEVKKRLLVFSGWPEGTDVAKKEGVLGRLTLVQLRQVATILSLKPAAKDMLIERLVTFLSCPDAALCTSPVSDQLFRSHGAEGMSRL